MFVLKQGGNVAHPEICKAVGKVHNTPLIPFFAFLSIINFYIELNVLRPQCTAAVVNELAMIPVIN